MQCHALSTIAVPDSMYVLQSNKSYVPKAQVASPVNRAPGREATEKAH